MLSGFLPAREHPQWEPLFQALAETRRAALLRSGTGAAVWVAAERKPQFEAIYPGASYQPPLPWRSGLYEAAAKYGSDLWKTAGVDEVARRLSARPDQPPVYAYRFDWGAVDARGNSPLPGNWGRKLGAFHSLDVPFFLGRDTLDGFLHLFLFTGQNAPGRKALSATMMRYAGNFARTGDPNVQAAGAGPGFVEWKPWVNTPGAPKCLIFDVQGDSPSIVMSTIELTEEGVMAAAKADLAEPLRSRTLDFLSRSILPSRVR